LPGPSAGPEPAQPSPLAGPEPAPKWVRIARDLSRQIAAGILAGPLPPERQLACRYQVSLQPVRSAIAALADAGLVRCARGRPTVVIARSPFNPTAIPSSPQTSTADRWMAQCRAAGQAVVVVDVPSVPRHPGAVGLGSADTSPDPRQAPILSAGSEQLWIVAGQPVAVDRIHLPTHTGFDSTGFDRTRFDRTRFDRTRFDEAGPVTTTEWVRAALPTAHLRGLLALPPHQPVWAITVVWSHTTVSFGRRQTIIRADQPVLSVVRLRVPEGSFGPGVNPADART